MTYQYSVTVRDARLDADLVSIGPSPRIRFFSGSLTANCAAPDPLGVLANFTLPAVWLSAAAAGIRALAGVWIGSAICAGKIISFRIYNNAGTVCHIQGDVAITGTPGAAMTVDNPNVAVDQLITVTQYTVTAGNA